MILIVFVKRLLLYVYYIIDEIVCVELKMRLYFKIIRVINYYVVVVDVVFFDFSGFEVLDIYEFIG